MFLNCRCQVPECGEDSKDAVFDQEWLINAIPLVYNETETFESCHRFMPIGPNGTLDVCPAELFDQQDTVECDGFVYERTNSVVYEVRFTSCTMYTKQFSKSVV